MAGAITVRQMWDGGPYRQISDRKVSPSFKPYGLATCTPTFAGRYVCSECQVPTGGVYGPKWLCAECRKQIGSHGGSGTRQLPTDPAGVMYAGRRNGSLQKFRPFPLVVRSLRRSLRMGRDVTGVTGVTGRDGWMGGWVDEWWIAYRRFRVSDWWQRANYERWQSGDTYERV